MSTLSVQHTEAAYLVNTDLTQTVECAEKDCPATGVLVTFECWRIWRGDRWGYFAFCCQEHALSCLPTTAMAQA